MPMLAPVSFHLDLYRYWLAKRGNGIMPARGDLEPGDIGLLLPYLRSSTRIMDGCVTASSAPRLRSN